MSVRKWWSSLPVAAALTLSTLPGALAAQATGEETRVGLPAVKSGTVLRVEEGPRIDGRLDEAVWQEATPLEGFVQMEPRAGAPVSERTVVRVLQDADALYVGAWLYDADVERIIVGERRRDANPRQSDGFQLILDTYRDQQNGFVFGTNPAGIEYDGQVASEGRGGGGGMSRQQGGAGGGFNVNWDGSWQVATSRDAEGWYAEFRIPFSTLRYGPGAEQAWGVNFERYIGRKNEEAHWSPIPRQFTFYRLSNAGLLEGLQLPPRRVLTVSPYALASAQRFPRTAPGTEYPMEFGGDAKVGITPSLTLDLTLNTDFAQVEVDEQQIDLTRFSLFFPEKRPFFLENAGLFAVGSNQSAQMFFSRRIGIGPGGRPVPINYGTRMSGRVGSTDVGVLHIRTGGLEGITGTNDYSVARIAQEFPNRSRVGAIVTQRMGAGLADDYGRTFAVDGALGVGEAFNFGAVLAKTETPGRGGGDEAILLNGSVRTRDWSAGAGYNQIGANFNPEVGFLRRSDYRQYNANTMYWLRTPQISWLRELRPHTSYEVSYSLDGFKETSSVHLDSHVQFENGSFFSPAFDWQLDGLAQPFAIRPGIVVQPGTYSGWTAAWRFNTSTRAPLVFRSGIDVGSFLSGERRGGFGAVEFRHGATMTGQVRLDQNRIELAEGSFDATLASGRLSYSFSPNLYVQSLVQYSGQTKVWAGNVRLGWLDTAGTGLFLVFNNRHVFDELGGPLERTFVVKYTRQFDLAGLGR
jgi:hypothetical protein